MRCEANVSVRPVGQAAFGTKVEVKNLNSFRSVKLALEYEVARQIATLEAGGRVVQVTMGWDEEHGRTVVQRSKESANDYRYFPEPDLPPLEVSPAWVAELRAALPELPDVRTARFANAYGLDLRDAALLAGDRAVADYFEATAAALGGTAQGARTAANWITGELFRLLNAAGTTIEQVQVAPAALADLLSRVERGEINANSGKRVLGRMSETGQPAGRIIEELGLAQVSDTDALAAVVDAVLARYPDEVTKYRAGKESVLGWLMGQVMRETKGKGNPALVRELLAKALGG